MWPAIISALAAIVASGGAIYLTKHQERKAIWRSKKLSYYEEFFLAASGLVGAKTLPASKMRFATAVNNLHLIGSNGVLKALHAFTAEIATPNRQHFSNERHDQLWSLLVWEIRADLGDPPTKQPTMFKAMLWASGEGRNA